MPPPTLVALPSEIRQRILRYTVTDTELREDIVPHSIGKKIVPWFTYYKTQRWTRDLVCLHSHIAQDMKWVEQRWLERGEEVARQLKMRKLGKGCKALCSPRIAVTVLVREIKGVAKAGGDVGHRIWSWEGEGEGLEVAVESSRDDDGRVRLQLDLL